MIDDQLFSLVVALGDLAHREEAAAALARRLGAEALVLFVEDPEIEAMLPGLGFPQTLSRAWIGLLEAANDKGEEGAAGRLRLGNRSQSARAFRAGRCGVVLLGGSPSAEALSWFLKSLPLLEALLRAELLAQQADQSAQLAARAAAEAGALTRRLDSVRRDLQARWRELSAAKSATEAAAKAKDDHFLDMTREIRGDVSSLLDAVEAMRASEMDDQVRQEALVLLLRHGKAALDRLDATLEFTPPEPDGSPAVQQNPPSEVGEPEDRLPSLHGCRVLLLEDRHDFPNLERGYLEEAGALVRVKSISDSAKEFLQQSSADVVVVDLHLPDQGGLDFVTGLREAGLAFPCLGLISSPVLDQEDKTRFLRAGFTASLGRPVERSELVRLAWTLMRCHRALRVLVVEDEGFPSSSLRKLVESLGSDCTSVQSRLKALSVSRDLAPDVVIVDLDMEAVEGWTLLGGLRTLAPLRNSRFVAVSESRTRGLDSPGKELHFDSILSKPVGRDALAAALLL